MVGHLWRACPPDGEAPGPRAVGEAMPRLELLVDAPAFVERLERDLAEARQRVFVQTMSFEGDLAGSLLARALVRCGAPDRRLLVDSYSRFVVSDKVRFFPRYWRDVSLRDEVARTRDVLRALQTHGVEVRLSNPMDPFLVRFMARNHKKLIVIDDRIAYFGGINFCDHNFAWRDMMIRVEDRTVADFLSRDFEASWRGDNLQERRDFGGVVLVTLDGRCNERGIEPVVGAIERATSGIVVHSGYLTFPFIHHLRAARARGVEVVLVTPELNNKPIVRDYLLWEAQRAGFRVKLYPDRMSHLKAMLIDGTTLVVGSSNFDFVSTTVQQELIAIITEPRLVSEYVAKVVEPDVAAARDAPPRRDPYGWPRYLAMRATGGVFVSAIRTMDRVFGQPRPQPAWTWTGAADSRAAWMRNSREGGA